MMNDVVDDDDDDDDVPGYLNEGFQVNESIDPLKDDRAMCLTTTVRILRMTL